MNKKRESEKVRETEEKMGEEGGNVQLLREEGEKDKEGKVS